MRLVTILFLALLALLVLAGCAPASDANPTPPATEAPASIQDRPDNPAPAASPPPIRPIHVDVDGSDFVAWGSGGGFDGGWSGTRVYGDGRVIHQDGQSEREERVDAALAARLVQAAADAGILDLKDHPTRGADMLGRGIQASLDGRTVSVSMDEQTEDPAWERVWVVLQVPGQAAP